MSTTMKYRYEIGANNTGVLDASTKKQDAIAKVFHLALNQPSLDGIYIYDRLATIGNANLWYYSSQDNCIHVAGIKGVYLET